MTDVECRMIVSSASDDDDIDISVAGNFAAESGPGCCNVDGLDGCCGLSTTNVDDLLDNESAADTTGSAFE